MPVYFIRVGDDGPVKIGISNNPAARLKAFDTHSPYPLRLIRVVDGTRQTERWLHKRYEAFHLRGEWFLYCPTMEGDLGLADLSIEQRRRPMGPPRTPNAAAIKDFQAYLEDGSEVRAERLAAWINRP